MTDDRTADIDWSKVPPPTDEQVRALRRLLKGTALFDAMQQEEMIMTGKFLVIGIRSWEGDDPIVIGVVPGEHWFKRTEAGESIAAFGTVINAANVNEAVATWYAMHGAIDATAHGTIASDACPVCRASGDAPCESSNGRLRGDHAARVRHPEVSSED